MVVGVALRCVGPCVLFASMASAAFRECEVVEIQADARILDRAADSYVANATDAYDANATDAYVANATDTHLENYTDALVENDTVALDENDTEIVVDNATDGAAVEEVRIAVYMYSVHPSATRIHFIPEVPEDIDAYFVVEGPAWTPVLDHTNGLLEEWRAKGWQILPITQAEDSNSTSQGRPTSRFAKFTPSTEMLEGYSWAVIMEPGAYVDLRNVRKFLDQHAAAPLVLLDWRHWTGDYNVTGYQCLVDEMEAMMEGAPHELITTNSSLKNCRRWLASMRSMRTHVARDNDLFPHYYDLSIMFRNLRHPYASTVASALHGVAQMGQYMELDRFVMPSFLKQHELTAEVDLVRIEDLQEVLGHCIVSAPEEFSEGKSLLSQFGGNVTMMMQAENATELDEPDSNISLRVKPASNITLFMHAGTVVSPNNASHGTGFAAKNKTFLNGQASSLGGPQGTASSVKKSVGNASFLRAGRM